MTKLQGKWNVVYEKLKPEYGEDLEGELARVLQEEIDWEILSSVFVESGWTKVESPHTGALTEVGEHEVKSWCKQNLKGHYKARGKDWLFERAEDATWFSLRWSS